MKIVKFGALALALGLFAASCNNEASTTETKTDSTTAVAPAPMAEPVAAPVADTAMHAAVDTTKMKTEAIKTTTTKTDKK